MNRRMFFKAAAVGGGAALGVDLSKAHAEARTLKIARTTETRSPDRDAAVGGFRSRRRGGDEQRPVLNIPLGRAREHQGAPRSVLPPLVTMRRQTTPRRERRSSETCGPQRAPISRPSSSTGTRTTSGTAGGGLGSWGGLRPR